ncbi:MAG: hypothetical protein NVS4B13_02900 [Candidatus Elarobacter sp.]
MGGIDAGHEAIIPFDAAARAVMAFTIAVAALTGSVRLWATQEVSVTILATHFALVLGA